MLDKLLKAAGAIEKIASTLAALFMLLIMLIVFGDVVMRYGFNRPFSWAYDLISVYLMAGVFFLVLSDAHARRAHVSVDILQQKFPPLIARISEIVTCCVGIVVFALIAWLGWQRALGSFRSNEVLAGAIPWPMWPSIVLVPFGAGLLALRLALQLIGHAGSLLTGRALIALPAHAAGEERFE